MFLDVSSHEADLPGDLLRKNYVPIICHIKGTRRISPGTCQVIFLIIIGVVWVYPKNRKSLHKSMIFIDFPHLESAKPEKN